MRGAHYAVHQQHGVSCGSSPHAWGTHTPLPNSYIENRFIPTCVGHTTTGTGGSVTNTVHPHMRGAHNSSRHKCVNHGGSSPHAWGTQLAPFPTPQPHRFIPTCVGHTSSAASTHLAWSVHPHMRGAHTRDVTTRAHHVGSSPHAWGTPEKIICRQRIHRFIPTCVGHTGGRWHDTKKKTVHPHMRGAHVRVDGRNRRSRGSSPHAWGTP